jgi:hypothetical protein
MHANLGPEVAGLVDVAAGYKTLPHVDMHTTATKVLTLLDRTVRGEIRPVGAIVRPGRILGYCCDGAWTYDGLVDEQRSGVRIVLGEQVKPGAMEIEWWDADRGVLLNTESLAHAGGPLALTPPTFRRRPIDMPPTPAIMNTNALEPARSSPAWISPMGG